MGPYKVDMTSDLIRSREFSSRQRRHTQEEGHVETEAEMGAMSLEAKGCWQPPGNRERGEAQTLPQRPQRKAAQPAPWLRPQASRREGRDRCCPKSCRCGTLWAA